MREDFQESLEKMFPQGFMIMYVQPNGDPAYYFFNPLADEFLENYYIAVDHILNHDHNN